MPLLDFYRIEDIEAYLGIWETEEPIEFFKKNLTLHPSEINEINGLKDRKLIEWYCSRYLLHLMSHRDIRGACLKDQYGKPYLENSSFYISMSHSHDRTAVIASPFRVGIDIQYIVPKIERIAKRFLSTNEMDAIPDQGKIAYYHLYWGAKEAMYKIYGRKEVDFSKELFVDTFTIQNGLVQTTGRVIKNESKTECMIRAQVLKDFVLVYAWER